MPLDLDMIPPLPRLVRDLANAARIASDVLNVIGRYGKPVSIDHLAKEMSLRSEDVRRALMALECADLVTTTHFEITTAGREARAQA